MTTANTLATVSNLESKSEPQDICAHTDASWQMVVCVDEEADCEGYDGDEPLPSELNWAAYLLATYMSCPDCDHDAEEPHDSLGSVWLTYGEPLDKAVRECAKDHGMLPEGVSVDDMSIEYDF